MSRPPAWLVLFTVLSLVAAACGTGGTATRAPGGPTQTAGTSQPAGSEPGASGSPAGSEPGASGSPAGSEPGASGSPATGTADISGDLQVLGKYTDADEIATTRYDIFTSQYPGVNVTFTETDFSAPEFFAAVQAGNPPDVVRMDRAIIGTYAAQGAIQPIDRCISDFAIDMSQYREAAVTASTFNDQVYGVPEFYDTRIILINDSVLDDAGVTADQIDTSDWDALAAVNQKLLAKDGNEITRIGFDPKLPEFLPLWAAANGTSLISDDGLTSNLDDPKVAEALTFAASLITAHGDAPSFLDFRDTGPGGSDFFGAKNQFAEDTLGAFPMEEWYLNVLAEVSPKEGVSFAPFKDKEGNNITFASGSAWVIPTGADNVDAACEFMRVITLPDSWYAAAKARADIRAKDGAPFTGTYTANKLADERIFADLINEETAGNYYDGVQLVLDTQDSAINLPTNAAAEAFTTIWQDAVNRVLNEGVPAEQALADADQEAQTEIDRAQP